MIDHLTLGITDYARSLAFYDAVMTTLGYTRLRAQTNEAAGYGMANKATFWFCTPLNESFPAQPCNGSHVAFNAPSQAAVQAFYQAALAHGGQGDGAPGLRPQYGAGYYAAFVRDPDGHKLEAVHNPQDVS